MRLITISGKAGSGKDTVAAMLRQIDAEARLFRTPKKDFQILHWADPLKEACAILTGIPLEKWHDREFKETYQHGLRMTGREYMLKLADAIRSVDDATFIKSTLGKMKIGGKYIIADTRVLKEIEYAEAFGAFNIRVSRPGPDTGDHKTETGLDGYLAFHWIIYNDGDKTKLYTEVEKAYAAFLQWERSERFFQSAKNPVLLFNNWL